MSKKKEKKTGPTLKINPLRIADNYLKRPCLKNVADRINLIAKNAFREIAPKYNDSDFFGSIEFIIQGGKYLTEFECVSSLYRCYEPTNIYGGGSPTVHYGTMFYLPVGENIKSLLVTFRFVDQPHRHPRPVRNLSHDIDERIIADAMNSIRTGTEYYDRLARKAKYLTAKSILEKHSPIIFETNIELTLYGARFGFTAPEDQAILKKAFKELRDSGVRI